MVKDNLVDGDDILQQDSQNNNGFVIIAIEVLEFIMSVVSFVVLFLFFVGRFVWVDGDSMVDTLHDKDYILVTNYFLSKPKYKDIVILNCIDVPYCDNFIIKRVIGVEGDIVDIKNGKVYVNGKQLEEDYAVGKTKTQGKIGLLTYPFKVPKGFIFYLGDNREFSADARDFGILPTDRISGKAIARGLPLRKIRIF